MAHRKLSLRLRPRKQKAAPAVPVAARDSGCSALWVWWDESAKCFSQWFCEVSQRGVSGFTGFSGFGKKHFELKPPPNYFNVCGHVFPEDFGDLAFFTCHSPSPKTIIITLVEGMFSF